MGNFYDNGFCPNQCLHEAGLWLMTDQALARKKALLAISLGPHDPNSIGVLGSNQASCYLGP